MGCKLYVNQRGQPMTRERKTTANSTYPKGGVSCFADTFVQAGSSVLRMNPDSYRDGKNPALRVAAKTLCVIL